MSNKLGILDIAMNLTRIGNWTADGYKLKQKRIRLFLSQTTKYIAPIDTSSFPESFKKTFMKFLKDYKKLEKEGMSGPKDELVFAERLMTWGNILTHRAHLIKD